MTERSTTEFIIVHCSATAPSVLVGEKEIRQWHTDRGWLDIGYNAVIRRDANHEGALLEIGRPLDHRGAHVAGYNDRAVGIVLIGGVDEQGKPENNFLDEQFDLLWQTIKLFKQIWPHAEVGGHRDYSPDADGDGVVEKHEWLKDCPCFDVRQWVREQTRKEFI